MNLSEPFIRRPVMTLLVMLSIFWFGFTAYRSLPVSDLPNIDFPTIKVSVSYPGASPDTMANSVALPLEQAFMTIDGIQTLFSTSNTGSTTIVLQFVLDRDIDAASTDVQAAINIAQPNLPSDLPNNPTYQKVNPSATPILYLAYTCENMTLGELYDYANTFIGQRLSMIEGVSQVLAYGAPYAVRIQVDPGELAAKNIGLDEVATTIQNANVNLPTGTLFGLRDEFTIDVDGQLLTAPPYAEIIIKNQEGQLVKIKDVGRTLDSLKDDKYAQSYVTPDSNQPSVILAVLRQANANSVRIIQSIDHLLTTIQPELPAALKVHRIYDQSETIIESVTDVKKTLMIAFVLVVIIIYLFLGEWKNTVIPALALPISLFGTFAIMLLLGFSIDILSLLAMTLSIGFLVDDAIVVLENNVRHLQMGKTPLDASITGAKEISITVFSMTICLIAAFIPMIFMEGVIGRLFREFALTIVVAVGFSGLVSLSLTPMLCSRFIRAYSHAEKTRMEHFAEWWNEKLKQLYEPCLHFAMRHRLYMLCLGFLSIIASLYLFALLPKDFLPPGDQGFIEAYTQARPGTSPFLMDDYHHTLSERIIHDPNVESLVSISAFANDNQGVLFVRLKPYQQRQPINTVIQTLHQELNQLPGVEIFLNPLPLINLQMGTTAQGLYQYSLTSINKEALYNYVPTLITSMKQDPAHFRQVSCDLLNTQPQLQLHIDRDKAYDLNVNANQIEGYFSYAYSDNKLSLIDGEINQYYVIVETLPKYYRNPSVLSQLFVRSSTNDLVPLVEILDIQETVGPLTINHLNGLTSVGISFNLPEGVALGDSLTALQTITHGTLPSGVIGTVQGTADVFKRSFASLNFLLLVALFVIYVVLGILYESFIHPLTVMSALPPALLGGLLTLYLFGETLSIYSFVGLILLIGIVLKNGILMVDFANEAVRVEHKSAYDAIIQACLIRFRPILMTTFSAIMGAVPIAIGSGTATSQSYVSLGLCIVGGLLISQLLTLLLTPVLYYYFELLNHFLRTRMQGMK